MAKLHQPDGDSTLINITPHTDSICEPCPNRRGLQCTTQDKISKLDQAHAAALNLNPPQAITWGEAKAILAKHLTLPVFNQICQGCEWKDYGICERTIKTKLLKGVKMDEKQAQESENHAQEYASQKANQQHKRT